MAKIAQTFPKITLKASNLPTFGFHQITIPTPRFYHIMSVLDEECILKYNLKSQDMDFGINATFGSHYFCSRATF